MRVHLLNEKMAQNAISLAEPFIEQLWARGYIKGCGGMFIMVALKDSTRSCGYKLLAEKSFRDRETWEHEYSRIACGKTRISARTGMSSREVIEMHPELLEPGDVLYWGNALEGDIIVSCSGVQSRYDELICSLITKTCKTMVDDKIEAEKDCGTDPGFIAT